MKLYMYVLYFFSIMLYFLYNVFTFNFFECIINTTRVNMHTCTKPQYPFSYKIIVLQIINISSSAFNHNYNYYNDMHVSFQTKSPYLYYCIVYLCYVFFNNNNNIYLKSNIQCTYRYEFSGLYNNNIQLQ